MKKARCFISYCSSDAKPDDVSAIVRYLDQMARSKEYNIEFLFDKDLSVGNDLNEFMQEIITVDSIIVICTPDYKKKYMNIKDEYVESGVYKECQLMKERISKRNKILEESIEEFDDNDFRIFPLVLSIEGKYSENSVPDFLTSLVREKINQIQFETSKGKRIITQQSKQLYNNIFLDCIISTCVIYSKKSEYLIMDMHEKLQKLIYNQKAEYAPTLDKRLFVNTFYFEQIKSQESYILVGRKGSGKTTTKLYFHSSNKEKYKGVSPLYHRGLSLQCPLDRQRKRLWEKRLYRDNAPSRSRHGSRSGQRENGHLPVPALPPPHPGGAGRVRQIRDLPHLEPAPEPPGEPGL